jgi:hypothetical protein
MAGKGLCEGALGRNYALKCIFLQKYLAMSKKSSTFAPAFQKWEWTESFGALKNFQFLGRARTRRKFTWATRSRIVLSRSSRDTVVLAQLVEHRIVVPSVVGSLRRKL